MNPKPTLLTSIVLALLLPAVATPATGAAVYVPAECWETSPDIPEECPGVRLGDPMVKPDNECIDPFTNFVYDCADPDQPLGTGLPTTYIWTDAQSALSEPACYAQGKQWCVLFNVATTRRLPGTTVGSGPIQVLAVINDMCNPSHPEVYRYERVYETVAEWPATITRNSQCGPNVASTIESSITVTNAETGAWMFEAHDRAYYGPLGWVGIGTWQCDNPRVSCKFYEDTTP